MKRTFVVSGFFILFSVAIFFLLRQQGNPAPIKVGILHSQTGTMATSEQPVIEATLFAVEELNRRGGVLGRLVEPVLADGGSDPAQFAHEAERLIEVEKVAVIFGCWTSASRKEVKAVVEKANHLLVYPLQYEGLEESPAIVYTGAVPNQQIRPAVKWAMDNFGKRIYLIGSDYIFPRIANHLIGDLAELLGGIVVAERYRPLGSHDFAVIAEEIATLRPAVVFNTLNGDGNLAFFAALHKQGVNGTEIPVFSFSVSESDFYAMAKKLPAGSLVGNYASWSYFESLPGKENQSFRRRYSKRYGPGHSLNDPMVSAYTSVQLWAQAVTEAASSAPLFVRRAFSRQSMNGPGGIVYIDDKNHHAWKPDRIAKMNDAGRFEIVWDSQKPIRPLPYPPYLQKSHWQDVEDLLYRRWNNRWAVDGEAAP